MKRICVLTILSLIGFMPPAQAAEALTLTVVIRNETGLPGSFVVDATHAASRARVQTTSAVVRLPLGRGMDTPLSIEFRHSPQDGHQSGSFITASPGEQTAVTFTLERMAPLNLSADATLEVTLPRLVAAVKGRVVDSAGRPVGARPGSSVNGPMIEWSSQRPPCMATNMAAIVDSLGGAYQVIGVTTRYALASWDQADDGTFVLHDFQRAGSPEKLWCPRGSSQILDFARGVDIRLDGTVSRFRPIESQRDTDLLICVVTQGPAFASPSCLQTRTTFWELALEEGRVEARARQQAQMEALRLARLAKLRATTIVCTKGKATRKVTSAAPRCPSGWRKRS